MPILQENISQENACQENTRVVLFGSDFDPNPDIDGVRRKVTSFIETEGKSSHKGPYDYLKDGLEKKKIQFKVTRSGGFYRGKQIVGMIRAAGMSVVGSTQLGMGVEVACTAHFAVSNCQLGHSPYERQGYGSGLLGLFNVLSTAGIKDDIITPTPLIADGYLYVPQSPGLGVEINPDGLAKFLEGSPVEIGDCPAAI